MRRTLVAFGTAGACIAEAVIHTCATGAIYIQDQLDILQLGNRNDPAVLRLQSAAAQYETFCQYTAGSRTSIKLYQTAIPRAGYEANESDPLAGLNNATGDQGLDAAIAWQTLWNQNMPQLLCSQEDSHIILCGFLGSYTGGIGMATLARALRSMPGDQALRIDMIGLLPFWRCTDDPAVTERTRCISSAMLRHYREQNLIADSDEQDLPAVDSACLMGLPMGAWAYLTAAEGTAPQMLHWIAARAVHDFFVTSGRFGVYTMGLAKDEIFWDAFGREGGAYQSAFNTMAMAAMLYRTELEPVIAARMHDTRLLRSLRKDWFTSRFGDAKRLSDPDGLLGRIQDIGEYYRLWCCWMAAMIHSLPPQLRDSEARDTAMQSAGEAYRQLLDAAGELYILQSEIDRSGMAEEQMVRRGAHTETTADRFLSAADSLREKLTRLEQVQASHDAIIGGMGKLTLIDQMLCGV